MTIRVDHTVAPQISRDTNQKLRLFFPDLNSEGISIDQFETAANSVLSLAASAVESLTFGDVVDVRGFYLEVNQDCYLRLNGSVDNIPVKLAPNASKAKVFIEADINQIQIQNLSTTEQLSGVYVLWGDPTA
jgi:hypothetical protein